MSLSQPNSYDKRFYKHLLILELLTVAYLFASAVPFFFGWLRTPWEFVSSAILMLLVGASVRGYLQSYRELTGGTENLHERPPADDVRAGSSEKDQGQSSHSSEKGAVQPLPEPAPPQPLEKPSPNELASSLQAADTKYTITPARSPIGRLPWPMVPSGSPAFDLGKVSVSLLLSIIWTYLSGTGGYCYQNRDWLKHNAVFRELIYSPWPIKWRQVPTELFPADFRLVYYLGYYLVPAYIGRFTGWHVANDLLFLWTACGVFLVFMWFGTFCSCRSWLSLSLLLLYFIAASGLDVVGYLIAHKDPFLKFQHLEWWTIWSLQSNTSLMFWAPQHSIGAWLATSLALTQYLHNQKRVPLVLPYAATLLWTPLSTIGLLPISVLSVIRTRALNLEQLLYTAASLVLAIIVGSYYKTLRYSFPTQILGLTEFQKYNVLAFYILEAGIYIALLLHFVRTDKERNVIDRSLLILLSLALLFMPILRFGLFNDFLLRASIPCTYCLWIMVSRRLLTKATTRSARLNVACLLATVVIGAVNPFNEIGRSISNIGVHHRPELHEVRPICSCDPSPAIVKQYIGLYSRDTLFYRFFGK